LGLECASEFSVSHIIEILLRAKNEDTQKFLNNYNMGKGKGKGKVAPVLFSELHAMKAYWGVEV
jgi:hypothetical protein